MAAVDRQQAQLVDVEPSHRHRQSRRLQPGSVAGRARPVGHVLLDLVPHVLGVGLPIASLQVRDDPFEDGHVAALEPRPVDVRHVQPLALGAVEEDILDLLRQRGPRARHVHLVPLGHRLDDLVVVLRTAARSKAAAPLPPPTARDPPPPAPDRSPAAPQAPARLAGPVGGVEREDAGRHLGQRHPVLRTGQVLGEEQAGQRAGGRSRLRDWSGGTSCRRRRVVPHDLAARAVVHVDHQQSVGLRQRRLHRVRQPAPDALLHDQPVDHDADVVAHVLVQLGQLLVHAVLRARRSRPG